MSDVQNPTAGPRAAASPTRLKVGVSIFIRKGERSSSITRNRQFW